MLNVTKETVTKFVFDDCLFHLDKLKSNVEFLGQLNDEKRWRLSDIDDVCETARMRLLRTFPDL